MAVTTYNMIDLVVAVLCGDVTDEYDAALISATKALFEDSVVANHVDLAAMDLVDPAFSSTVREVLGADEVVGVCGERDFDIGVHGADFDLFTGPIKAAFSDHEFISNDQRAADFGGPGLVH